MPQSVSAGGATFIARLISLIHQDQEAECSKQAQVHWMTFSGVFAPHILHYSCKHLHFIPKNNILIGILLKFYILYFHLFFVTLFIFIQSIFMTQIKHFTARCTVYSTNKI